LPDNFSEESRLSTERAVAAANTCLNDRISSVREGAKAFFSTWKVDSIYDFEPFSVGYFTNIPLAEGYVLKLPDGLSHHLTTIGVASDFSYTASWTERWTG
jgi:hypothetical protein